MSRAFRVGLWVLMFSFLGTSCTATPTAVGTNTPVGQTSPTAQMEQIMTGEDMTKQPTRDTAVALQAEAQIQGNNLVVTYRVINGLDETIYLVNRIFQWTATGLSLDPNLAYTEREGDSLRLVKGYLPVPDDLDVEAPVVPFLTAVPAGKTFSETLTLPLPLQPYDPYDQGQPTDDVTTYSSVQFVVGWFAEGDTAVTSQNQPDGTILLSADYADVEKAQNLLQSQLAVPVSTNIE